jgi:hypothetical protein
MVTGNFLGGNTGPNLCRGYANQFDPNAVENQPFVTYGPGQ